MGVGKRIDRSVTYGSKTATGKTIRERIWGELDDAMDHLMDDEKPESWIDDRDTKPFTPVGIAEEWREYGRWQGIAEGVAMVLALFENPIHTSLDDIRAAAVMRYKDRKAEAEKSERKIEDVEAQQADEEGGQST